MKNSIISILFLGTTLLVSGANANMKCGAGKCGAAMMQGEKVQTNKGKGDEKRSQAATDAIEKNAQKKASKEAQKMQHGAK